MKSIIFFMNIFWLKQELQNLRRNRGFLPKNFAALRSLG